MSTAPALPVLSREGGTPLRERIAATDAAASAAFDAGADIDALLRARADAVEAAVRECFAPLRDVGLALLAAGGFGRRTLHPRSDVDLVLLAGQPIDESTRHGVEDFVARCWDAGLPIGHAVRTIAECVDAARGDVSIYTNLLDARRIDGAEGPWLALVDALTDPSLWPADEYAAAKLAEQRARHSRYDDTAYNLEPNLKEGPGGLRELQTPLWIAQRQLGAGSLDALRGVGLLGPEEHEALEAARRHLARVRFALHRLARRPEERLLFEYQRELAVEFGYRDEHAQNLAVEQFMQRYFRAAMNVQRLGERLLQRLAEARETATPPRALGSGFVAIERTLDVEDERRIEREPVMLLRAFRMLLEHPELTGLRSTLQRSFDAVLPGLDEGFRRDPAVAAEFLAIFRHPGDVAGALAAMSRHGVLGRFLPAFGRVAGRMQYDLFHVYTVDQHTLFVLRNLRAFADPACAQEFPLAHRLHARLRQPELLLLAGLFHDIAKGRGGDHSELGAEDARTFCAQIGLPPADAALVEWLVREHLLMSVTAQKRDITDPDVVHAFAGRVGDRERLDHLYLLTVADIRGTSPRLWNSWKARLLEDLHEAARLALRRGLSQPLRAAERIAQTQGEALALLAERGIDAGEAKALWARFPEDSFVRYTADQVAWISASILEDPEALPRVAVRPAADGAATEIFVHSPDRDGLFATITAVLDRQQLGVLDARIVSSRDGRSLDSFRVLDAEGRPLEDAGRMRAVERALLEALRRPVLDLAPARRARSSRQRQFQVPVRIGLGPVPGRADRTQLELICADRPGLLAQVAQELRRCGLRVHDARIATFGERAEDFFVLSDENDLALDADRCARLRAALESRLADATQERT